MMKMGDTKVRISAELYQQLKQLAEKSGKSMRELVDEAIRAYLLGSTGVEGKEIKGITAKIIPLQYPARCKRCGKQLNPGELAYWVKITYTDNSVRSFIYCLDCYYQSSALKEHYLKKRQLEKVIRELKKEADELADKVLELRREANAWKLAAEIRDLIREAWDVLEIYTDPQKRGEVQKLIDYLDRLNDVIKRLETLEEEKDVARKVKRAARRQRHYY